MIDNELVCFELSYEIMAKYELKFVSTSKASIQMNISWWKKQEELNVVFVEEISYRSLTQRGTFCRYTVL